MADEFPLDRDDVGTIMVRLFDIRVGVQHIIELLEEDDEEEAGEEDDA